MDLKWVQAGSNLISLLTITLFTKKMFLLPDHELSRRWTVIGLISADALMSIGHVLIIGDAYLYEEKVRFFTLCKFQAFLIHFGMISSFLWINVMVLMIYNKLTLHYEISKEKTTAFCFLVPFAYCLFFWMLGALGAKSYHSNYCGIVDSWLSRVALKIVPWLLTTCLQIYYVFEIYRMLSKRAVTLSEWKQVGKLLLFPFSVIIIYIFGVANFMLEINKTDDDEPLAMFLIIGKNLLTGLQGFINCMLYGYEDYSLKVASCLFCIQARDDTVAEEQPVDQGQEIQWVRSNSGRYHIQPNLQLGESKFQ